MARHAVIDGREAWCKDYRPERGRRLGLFLLDLLARSLRIPALRPVAPAAPEVRLATEVRRLGELAAAGVRVPPVLRSGGTELCIGDIGRSYSPALREAAGDPAARDELVGLAAAAIAAAHRAEVCLGAPFPRNLTLDGRQIGFLDFEEDPGTVMPLAAAKVRDWALFAYGVARHYPDGAALAACLRPHVAAAEPAVLGGLAHLARKLAGIGRLSRLFGRRAAAIGVALEALRRLAPD